MLAAVNTLLLSAQWLRGIGQDRRDVGKLRISHTFSLSTNFNTTLAPSNW
jgi:hypothetical protein